MAGFLLLAYLLAGAGLQITSAAEKKDKDSDVKYDRPVVYTNLPPPVLYFPNFPDRTKLSNRGSAGDLEDKRVEYVPFPYKDLPLLVYQSESQPPVHVVEKNPNQDSENDGSGTAYGNQGYQTGPAVYRQTENDQYRNEGSDSNDHQQSIISAPSINVGLSTSPIHSIDAQNQQYISIGVTSLQPQGDQSPSHVQQQSGAYYNQVQYSGSQNNEQVQYQAEDSQQLGQGGPSFVYYSSQQYPSENADPQIQVPTEQITQAIQNYLLQQSPEHTQYAQSIQNAITSYPIKQSEPIPAPSSPTQHVGITIIRQPAISNAPEHSGNSGHQNNYQDSSQIRHPQPQANNDPGYAENQPYVSIGVYPVNTPGNDYGQDPQQYYNMITADQNSNYQITNDEYRQPNPDPPKAEPAGYQLISIDLSALRNKNSGQERNVYAEQIQQGYHNMNSKIPIENPSPPPPPPPPPQNYRVQNQNGSPYAGGEKQYQQILIQIPQNILSEQSGKAPRGRGPNEMPYTGTAQVANVLGNANKASSRPPVSAVPVYNRPPQNTQYSERPRNPPEAYSFPQNGVLSNGINIAIIKQTDSSNNSPVFKQPIQKRPHAVRSHKATNHQSHISGSRNPYPTFNRRPQEPSQKRPLPPNNPRFQGRPGMPAFASAPYPVAAIRYPPQKFGEYRSKPVVRHLGGHPGLYASSNLHFTTMNPPIMRPPFFGNAYAVPPSIPFPHASASKHHPHFLPHPLTGNEPFNPLHSESALHHAFTNNISNSFGEVSFDEINAFLNPNYDLFGAVAVGEDKKKEEEETRLLHKVTNDLIVHDLAAASMVAGAPPYGIVKPPPNVLNAPFPYQYWEQPVRNFGPPTQQPVPGRDRTRLFSHYSHFQHPYMKRRPLGSFGRGKGRGLGKGYKGIKGKLAQLRTSIRHKSKIAPRQEIISEVGTEIMTDSSMFDKASPRSTIIKTERPELDGITIPLHSGHVLSSRVSTDEEESEKYDPVPPIIVYKGSKPPVEVYGSKADIEGNGKDNETEFSYGTTETSKSENLNSAESVESYSLSQGVGYLDYMYSMLPDLIRDSLGRRHDGGSDTSKWLPVRPVQYALAEDTYDRNETSSSQVDSPIELEILTDSSAHSNSSTNPESSIKENVEELFSLLGKEEKSDLVKE